MSEDLLEALRSHAPALVPLLQARPQLADEALAQPLETSVPRRHFDAELAAVKPDALGAALRHIKQRTLLRLAAREFGRHADVQQTSRELSEFAGAALQRAAVEARAQRAARFGDALDHEGRPIPFVVMGMGKLLFAAECGGQGDGSMGPV
ncbi:MAG: hypothetical protein AAF645_10735 [Myxococcota bacterium]